jgi:hypothetical protein
MSQLRLTARIDGLNVAQRRLRNATTKIPARSLKRAIKAGSKPLVASGKVWSPVDTGTMRKAMTMRAKSYRRGQRQLAVIGPRNRKYANGKNPNKYAHLVELGRNTPGGGRVAGNPFLRTAAQFAKSAAVREAQTSLRGSLPADFSDT